MSDEIDESFSGQPLPVHVPGGEPIHDVAMRAIQYRRAHGEKKYGTVLQARNGRDALIDCAEELLDGLLYITQAIIERDGKLPWDPPLTFHNAFHGGDLTEYCYDQYNYARTNERAIEVPIFLDWISQRAGDFGLEVGNVLKHYAEGGWSVVDRYEVADGVLNADIMDIEPRGGYDWIVSISTVEHIGWDDTPRDPTKALDAIVHMRRLLTPDGRLLLSFPTGHNQSLDAAVAEGLAQQAINAAFYRRTDNYEGRSRCPATWETASFEALPYLWENFSAAGVWIAEFDPLA